MAYNPPSLQTTPFPYFRGLWMPDMLTGLENSSCRSKVSPLCSLVSSLATPLQFRNACIRARMLLHWQNIVSGEEKPANNTTQRRKCRLTKPPDSNAAMGCNTECGANFDFKRPEAKCLGREAPYTKLLVLMPNMQFRLLHFDSGILDFDDPP